MTTQAYTFKEGAGETAPKGKPQWPQFLRLEIQRGHEAELVQRLVAHLEKKGKTSLELQFFGELERAQHDDIIRKTADDPEESWREGLSSAERTSLGVEVSHDLRWDGGKRTRWNSYAMAKALASLHQAEQLLAKMAQALGQIESNDPEGNRQKADTIANKALGLFREKYPNGIALE